MKATCIATTLAILPLLTEGLSAQATPTPYGAYRTLSPYRFVGKLTATKGFADYAGSATGIRPFSILTAAHCLYDPSTGWASNVTFTRSYHYGDFISSSTASRLIILGGYAGYSAAYGKTSGQAFNRDTGAAICYSQPCGGGYAGWWANTYLLTGPAFNMSLGYGAEYHDGQELLRSAPTKAFSKQYGAWFKNRSYSIEGGMSGGPVFAKSGSKWYVCAVNVSNASGYRTSGAGVRALDSATTSLIKNSLR